MDFYYTGFLVAFVGTQRQLVAKLIYGYLQVYCDDRTYRYNVDVVGAVVGVDVDDVAAYVDLDSDYQRVKNLKMKQPGLYLFFVENSYF